MAFVAPTLVSVAQASVTLYTTGKAQRVIISNFSANNITVSSATPAVASTGVIIAANASYTFDTTRLSNAGRVYVPTLYAISATGTNAVGVQSITDA